ncbi:hypothetical protein DFP72DRAFT_930098 [Ephemerocybe angulata]|uniref:Uncharacterized protein n=1 Tax=Ephemerocybe angulata TaxID=980116 RepID=A0A8H6LVG4_9AGAR|nr:hypothetical protein DFP72DRAFT_930098 [Tulosesus angulatus]
MIYAPDAKVNEPEGERLPRYSGGTTSSTSVRDSETRSEAEGSLPRYSRAVTPTVPAAARVPIASTTRTVPPIPEDTQSIIQVLPPSPLTKPIRRIQRLLRKSLIFSIVIFAFSMPSRGLSTFYVSPVIVGLTILHHGILLGRIKKESNQYQVDISKLDPEDERPNYRSAVTRSVTIVNSWWLTTLWGVSLILLVTLVANIRNDDRLTGKLDWSRGLNICLGSEIILTVQQLALMCRISSYCTRERRAAVQGYRPERQSYRFWR